MAARKKFGEVLVEAGAITPGQLEYALTFQKGKNKRLGKLLVELGHLDERQIAEALSGQLRIPLVRAGDFKIAKEILSLVPKQVAEEKLLLPLEVGEGGRRLLLAMADPLDWQTIDNIAFSTGMKVSVAVSAETDIVGSIEKHYGAEEQIWDLLKEIPSYEKVQFLKETEERVEKDFTVQSLYKLSEAPPIIKLVTMVLVDAVKSRASDIHIEPREGYVQVRYRVDGDLKNVLKYPKNIQDSVVSRVKIISNLDITNRRLPQDGRSTLKLEEKSVDLRVSTLPSIYGETIVVRLLDRTTGLIPLGQLGMPERVFDSLAGLLNQPQGTLLITGPTGSGKTTTLYAILQQLQTETESIITIEDPVEYKLPAITQVGINEAIGLGFPEALRSILRQDPDIIMVGEIRDRDTADIAARSALTGHLVLSTLHTNDTVSTIARLLDIGLEPFLVTSAVTGILAQRLVRRICPECRVKTAFPEDLKKENLPPLDLCYVGKGCKNCNFTGYRGQVGIYEFLRMSVKMKRLITKGASDDELWRTAVAEGTVRLFDDAWEKAGQGVTTVEEILLKVPRDHAGREESAANAERVSVLAIDVSDDEISLLRQLEPDAAVLTAYGGDGAEVARRRNPDVIALAMSDLAETLLGGLRRDIRTASIPVLAISDASGKDDEERWLASGISGVIYRPLTPHKLHFYIDRALRRY